MTARGLEPAAQRKRHLVTFEEVGASGLARWIALRDEFGRALDPVITSIDFRNERASTVLAHTGPGLEALGYLLLRRDGVSRKEAADASLRSRLERSMLDVDECVPFDTGAWPTRFAAVYNSLKHANREAPEVVDVMNVWREGVLAVRAWVALELGVGRATVAERLRNDPQRYPYVVTD